MPRIRALRDCKPSSLTLSKTAPIVSKEASPIFLGSISLWKKNRRKKSTEKSKSGFGSFAAKAHTASGLDKVTMQVIRTPHLRICTSINLVYRSSLSCYHPCKLRAVVSASATPILPRYSSLLCRCNIFSLCTGIWTNGIPLVTNIFPN